MDKSRFSLLLLEPGENYFEDFDAKFSIDKTRDKQLGRLKLCSKSLVFEPNDINKPLLKILFQNCQQIESKGEEVTIKCKSFAEMLAGNIIAPYTFRHTLSTFYIDLLYVNVDDFLPHILQLKRASTLQTLEQNSMIAAIAFSRQSRNKFDVRWLEDLNETIIMEMEGSKVSPLIVNPGRVVLTTNNIYFQPFNNAEVYPVFKINISRIRELTKRRFLHRHVGLEIFCEGTSIPHFYLILKSEDDRQRFFDELTKQPKLCLNQMEWEIMTLKWQNRLISNYDYLLYVNSLADRSFNDLTQYPVFPWVISDYTSTELNLNDPKVYRDLTKPLGALNPERLQRLKKRRLEMNENSFLYGSHYSTPGFVLFYLVRKYPQYMLCLQNGRFDHPDRIFFCLKDVWRNVNQNMADFKELIPEFYDIENNGDFLVNSLGIDLGVRQDGVRVRDVVLPPWSSDPGDFVKRLRDALESEIVSKDLPAWIDLVFGWKQRGRAAEEADNVFYHICYEGSVDLDKVSDAHERHALEIQIMEFGQIPKQIFNVPHPPRRKLSPSPLIPTYGLLDFDNLEATIIAKHKDLVTSVACHRGTIISVGRDSVLKEINSNTKELVRSVHLDTAGISTCALLPDCITVILGTFDNRILFYSLECCQIMDEVRAHEDAVSCLSFNVDSGALISGSWDGSVRIWLGAVSPNFKGRLHSKSAYRIDRDSRIMCLALDKSGEFTACGTEDGEVSVFHTNSPSSTTLEYSVPNTPITALTITGTRLISCSLQGFQVHDIPTGLLVYSTTENLPIKCLASTGEILFFGSIEGCIHCWDLQKVKQLQTIYCPSNTINCLAVSSSDGYIVSGEGNLLTFRA